MALVDVTSAADLDALLSSSSFTVCHFWAQWCEPCGAMDQLMREMAAVRPNVRFARVEAEEVDALAERYEISAVPYFTLHHNAELVDTLEGADAKALASKVQQHFGVATVTPPAAAAPAAPAEPVVDIETRLKQLTTQAPVVLFIKGTRVGATRISTQQGPYHNPMLAPPLSFASWTPPPPLLNLPRMLQRPRQCVPCACARG